MSRITPARSNDTMVYVPGQGYRELTQEQIEVIANRMAKTHWPTDQTYRWIPRWPFLAADDQRCQLDGWIWPCDEAKFAQAHASRRTSGRGLHRRDPATAKIARLVGNAAVITMVITILGFVGIAAYVGGGGQ